ncbi:MAG: 50S ribosomal protein L20 [Chloroflexi bacterium]|nr:50S ribosomal protein L20 [Chloroflexota bacterium]
MPRVKRGVTTGHRHKRLLQMTKGHRRGRHSLFRQAKESLLKALSHAYNHRRERKGDMRRLWIMRINAAARSHGMSYSQLVYGLSQAKVAVDRKIMADLAVRDDEAFAQLVAIAKEYATPEAVSA